MKTQTCKTAAVMGLISRGPASAPAHAGGSTPAPAERTIEEITADILQAQVDGGKAVLIIGNGLIEAKGKLDHGQWLDWLTENVGYSEKSAENYMRIARNYSNPQLVADLGMRKALSLLALPETDRETFVAEANVVDMTSRELEKAVRERAEALEAKDAAERLLHTAQVERDTALSEAMERQKLLRAAELETTRLSQELDELKSRPVEVAVQVDQEAVEKAREEGYQQAKKELKTAEKAAGEQVSKANADAASIKTELQKKQKEVENLQFELERAREKLEAKPELAAPSPLSTDAELAQFKLLFDQAQTIVNQMRGLLLKVRKRNDEENTGKLEAALAALSDKVRGCAA